MFVAVATAVAVAVGVDASVRSAAACLFNHGVYSLHLYDPFDTYLRVVCTIFLKNHYTPNRVREVGNGHCEWLGLAPVYLISLLSIPTLWYHIQEDNERRGVRRLFLEGPKIIEPEHRTETEAEEKLQNGKVSATGGQLQSSADKASRYTARNGQFTNPR